MLGKVVSYISTKKFGFIKGDDGESYFFHFSSLMNKADESKLVRGVVVEFDPIPTPKGLAAKKVVVPEVFFKQQLVKFFTSRSSQPKYGKVLSRRTLCTRFFKDPNEGRSYINELAQESGCNAILNLEFEKTTFSSGNYQYTVHAFKGDFAVVVEDIPCAIEEAETAPGLEIEEKISEFERKFAVVNQRETQAREKQLSKSRTGLYLLVAVLFAIGLFVASR